MATATSTARRRVYLREDYAQSGAKLVVDREAQIIRHVKVAGLESPNTHGIKGIKGTRYTLEAYQEAVRRGLYTGLKVNVNHPDRDKPHKDRQAEDRYGKILNPVVEADGVYGDLWYLASHEMTPKVLEAAEKMPDLFALSHNAMGDGDIIDGYYVVSRIPEVRSVDLVADGATNISLRESRERFVKIKLKTLVKTAKNLTEKKRKRILEAIHALEADDMDMEVEEDAEPEYHDHLGQAILAIMGDVKDGKMSPEEGQKKVLAAYKLAMDDGEEEETDTEEDDEKVGGKEEKDKAADAKADKMKEESRKLKQENLALRLCLEGRVEPSRILLKTLCLLESEAEMKELIAEQTKAEKPAPKPSDRPRSIPWGSRSGVPVQEGTETHYANGAPKKADDQLKYLVG